MSTILILSEEELRAIVSLSPETIDVIEEAFRALTGAGVVMPSVLSMALPEKNGEVDIKTAYLPGVREFAIKVSPGFFDNPKIGLPSLNGLMIVLSSDTGMASAVLLDNGYLTNVRTAAAGAVAARWLAPRSVRTATVFGAGMQARLQSIAAHMVRPFEKLYVWAPDIEEARACARYVATATGVDARAVADPAQALAESQLAITTTPAHKPILLADWLHPGLHITCMGSDQEDKNELDPYALEQASLYVCDRVSQCARLGELRSARAIGLLQGVNPPELGDVITGKAMGRTSEEQVTICDLTGTGAQDTAIAAYALSRAVKTGGGLKFDR